MQDYWNDASENPTLTIKIRNEAVACFKRTFIDLESFDHYYTIDTELQTRYLNLKDMLLCMKDWFALYGFKCAYCDTLANAECNLANADRNSGALVAPRNTMKITINS